ncbi:MAG: hypothetical protein KTR24_10325 [Saprospiraceae bacterium]|nr:hypothetical protein [Saprospiraceae bacterium]
MHDIEPHYLWRDSYVAAHDHRSPHYGRTYDEFRFTNKIYNYFIHPQWDEFGSGTLYSKIIYVDYDEHVAIVELIGEWNDCLGNDILFLKQNIIDPLLLEGVRKFILLLDNVLTFHGSDNCYYEEWYEDLINVNGYISFVNVSRDVGDEMTATQIHHYVNLGAHLEVPNWRSYKPTNLTRQVEMRLQEHTGTLELP